jgi:IS30 family transposase
MGLAAEIERDLIRQRTKEGIDRVRAEGRILGRKTGGRVNYTCLDKKYDEIVKYIDAGCSMSDIARLYNVDRCTVSRFINNHIELKPRLPQVSEKMGKARAKNAFNYSRITRERFNKLDSIIDELIENYHETLSFLKVAKKASELINDNVSVNYIKKYFKTRGRFDELQAYYDKERNTRNSITKRIIQLHGTNNY